MGLYVRQHFVPERELTPEHRGRARDTQAALLSPLFRLAACHEDTWDVSSYPRLAGALVVSVDVYHGSLALYRRGLNAPSRRAGSGAGCQGRDCCTIQPRNGQHARV